MSKKQKPKVIEYGPANTLYGYRNVRWVENASRGLRFVGYADKIVRLNHHGWYTRDDGDSGEVYRGVVYQLSARNKVEGYVFGYADPNNDDCALVCFETETVKEDAALRANHFAEVFAEHEREFNRTWDAGQRYRELAEEIAQTRKDALQIGAEMRAVRAATNDKLHAPKLCATLRNEILSLYRTIQKLRKERAKLFSSYGHRDGFAE